MSSSKISSSFSLFLVASLIVAAKIAQDSRADPDFRNSPFLTQMIHVHNELDGDLQKNYSETLALLRTRSEVINDETRKQHFLMGLSEISEEKCKNNITLQYYDFIVRNPFVSDNIMRYLNQSMLGQRVLCLKVSCDNAFKSIGNEYERAMESLGEKIKQSDSEQDTRKHILACMREIKGETLCTPRAFADHETTFNETIGRLANTIKRHFEPILMEAEKLKGQVELNLRLNAKSIKWLFSYVPIAKRIVDFCDHLKNATLRELIEDCDSRSRFIPFGDAIYREDAPKITALMQNIYNRCSKHQNGTLNFNRIFISDFINGLYEYLIQVTDRQIFNTFSGNNQWEINFNQVFKSTTFDMCSRVKPRIAPYLEVNGTRELPDGWLENQVNDVFKVCNIIVVKWDSIQDKTRQLHIMRSRRY